MSSQPKVPSYRKLDSDKVESQGVEVSAGKRKAPLEASALPTNNAPVPSSPTTTCRHTTLSWSLLAFVFSVLAWVGTWTILAAHTDTARNTLNPTFETKYFPDKAGVRVFTYLLVFYVLAGVVSLAFLAKGIRLPTPTPFLMRCIRVPGGEYWTILEMAFLGVFLAVQIATIITRVETKFHNDWTPEWDASKLWYEITKTLGKTAAITLLFLFLPISKGCFWLDLFNLKFERSVKFHRWLSWFLVVVVVVHAATAVTSLSLKRQFKNCMWPSDICEKPGGWGTHEALETSRIITYGWTSFLVALPLVVTSLPWFRRHKFEWFYYTHFLFIPIVILWHLHYHQMIYYAAPSLAAYILDKVLWWCSSRRPIQIVSLTTPAPGFVRMVIAVDPHNNKNTFEPGQWIQINVPAVSFWEWHPMSVTSAPGHSTITVDIKVLGDWTRRLQALATRFDSTKPAHTCVFVDRFQGSSHRIMQGYLNHPAVLMFAGGIGVTPMISALRTIVEDGASVPNVRRVVFVWVVRRKSVVNLYQDELARIQAMGRTANGCQVDVIVHATLSEKEPDTDLESPPATEAPDRSDCAQGAPFTEKLKGYWHLLLLTAGAGGGYFLGIFLANFISYEREWLAEFVSLLQLGLAVLCTVVLVVIGICPSFFRSTPVWDEDASKKRQNSREGSRRELDLVVGCRPDVDKIVNEMKTWCAAYECSSVGVAVCGPDQLIRTVTKTCRKASSSSVQFVMDIESFDW